MHASQRESVTPSSANVVDFLSSASSSSSPPSPSFSPSASSDTTWLDSSLSSPKTTSPRRLFNLEVDLADFAAEEFDSAVEDVFGEDVDFCTAEVARRASGGDGVSTSLLDT